MLRGWAQGWGWWLVLRTVEGTNHSLTKHGSPHPAPLLSTSMNPTGEGEKELGAARGTLCLIPPWRLRGTSRALAL